MIDIHCHILPGLDDGSPDMETSLELAREAEKQGISEALLTPHHMDGKYINHLKCVENETIEFQKKINEHGINLKVFPGQEVHLTGDLLKAIDNGDILFADPYKRYIMLELPHNEIPEYTESMFFELRTRGIIPVIVHPERNYGFQNNHDLLYKFVSQGIATQLTASSYVGIFGHKVEKFAEEIIKSNLSTTFGSDAHNFKGRRCQMKDAYLKLEKNFGVETLTRYKYNAKAILNGDDIYQGNIMPIKKKKLFGLF